MANDFRIYFDTEHLNDSLLAQYVTLQIVEESSKYVESFALSLGVNPARIPINTPYPVSRLAELFAYMTTAFRKAQFSKGKDADVDSFALKYKAYKVELRDWEDRLNANSFIGDGKTSSRRTFPMTMPLARN